MTQTIQWPNELPLSGNILPDGSILSAPGSSHESLAKSAGYRSLSAFLKAGGVRYRLDRDTDGDARHLSVQAGRKGIEIAAELIDMLRPRGYVAVDLNASEGSRSAAGALETGFGCDYEDALKQLRRR